MTESPTLRAKELFLAALDLPEGERTAFVLESAAGDEDIVARVERLLAAHERAERGALDPASGVFGDLHADTAVHTPVADPEVVHAYRIVRRLGEGGMGIVYLAEQEHPIRRMVALKLVRAGMDTRHVLARFESERQALARMTHPNIARILDAGTSEDGRPYFVMEYVAGEPITEFCDARRMPLRERLELMQQVCDAVQHAHQKGVIHRDLKPSNVLVAELDGRPTPKVIDFGIAKAVEQDAAEPAAHTIFGQLVGTPDYMSPEQADPMASDVDTRSDVYALGVVLYQLLCGATPFGFSGSGRAITEIQRTIRDVEPPSPSARLTSAEDQVARAAAADRSTTVVSLARVLRGDLDWIAIRALEKHRDQRYASAAELGAELERHLAGEPVLAGPPSTAYLVRKFVRRHRMAVGIAAASVLALLVFAITMAAKNRVIADERDRANEATRRALAEAETSRRVTELFASVFDLASPDFARGREPTAREILERGTQRVRAELQDQPEVRARLLGALGVVHRGIGRYEDSRKLLREALELSRAHLGREHRFTTTVTSALAQTHARLGEFDEARRLLEEELGSARTTLGSEDADTLDLERNLVELDIDQHRNVEAMTRAIDLLAREQRAFGADSRQALTTEGLLALAELGAGLVEDSAARFESLIERQREVFGTDHPATLTSMHNLLRAYLESDRLADAEELCEHALELRRRVFGANHPETLATLNTQGIIHMRAGRYDDADRVFLEAIDGYREALGDDHPSLFNPMLNRIGALAERRRLAEAEALADEILEVGSRTLGDRNPKVLAARLAHALILLDTNRTDESIAELEPLLADQREELGKSDPKTLATAEALVTAYFRAGRLADAERVRTESADALAHKSQRVEAVRLLISAAVYAAADGRSDDALAHLRRACEYEVRVPPFSDHPSFTPLAADPEFRELAERMEDRGN